MKTSTLLTASIFALSLTAQAVASKNAPTIDLIPVTAQESIKQSAASAKTMKDKISPILDRIENQKTLYKNAKCDGAVDDKGCDQIFKTMSTSYKSFLEVLNEELPNLSKQLGVTAKSIEKQIRKKLGKGMTPVDLQRLVSGRKANGRKQLKARTGNNSYSMVALLSNMEKAISTSGHGDVPAVVASDIYINMLLATDAIEQIQVSIGQSLATIDTYNAFGQLSSHQLDTISSVKGMLFGQTDTSNLPGEEISEAPTETYTWEESL